MTDGLRADFSLAVVRLTIEMALAGSTMRNGGETEGVGKKKTEAIRISCYNLLGSDTWSVQRIVGCRYKPKPVPVQTTK